LLSLTYSTWNPDNERVWRGEGRWIPHRLMKNVVAQVSIHVFLVPFRCSFIACLFLLFNSLELSACCKCQGRLKVHGHVCCSSQAATERQNNHRHERANERNRVTSKLEDNGPIGDISRCNGHAHDRQADCDQRDEQEPDDDFERV
jgi:hypothetical protein